MGMNLGAAASGYAQKPRVITLRTCGRAVLNPPRLPMRVDTAGMPPAICDDAPVLAAVQAPRVARPLRVSAWTSGCAPEVRAFIAGLSSTFGFFPLVPSGLRPHPSSRLNLTAKAGGND